MMSHFATALLTTSMLFAIATIPVSGKAVTFTGAIQPDTAQADHFTVTVQMDIRKGWHTYDEAGEGPEERTSLELKLPEGVIAKSDWIRPKGIDGKAADSRIYEGQVSFSTSVDIQPNAYGKNIDVVVSYQACTDETCSPPQNKTVSITIPAAQSDSSLFEGPVRIKADGKPLNTVAKKMFASPGIFDIDGDGQAELVIGGLMGSVGVYENQNTSGTGDPAWGPRNELKDAKGKTIRTSNW